jgi:hypothetical protein
MQDSDAAEGGTPQSGESEGITKGSAPLDDTPVANPLGPAERTAAAAEFEAIALRLEAEMDGPAPADELAEVGGDEGAWRRQQEQVIRRVRSVAQALGHEQLEFSVATLARSLLEDSTQHLLKAAAAALEAAIEAVFPQRAQLIRQQLADRKRERGFSMTHVGGRDEPLALPAFTYTDGLAQNDHPELVIVGFDGQLAGSLLDALGGEITAGELTIKPGQDISGHLQGDYIMRAVDAPAALVTKLRIGHDATAVQILLPDADGLFDGEAGVDEQIATGQRYPDGPDERERRH